MRAFRDLSIQKKLFLILLLAGSVGVTLACAAFVWSDIRRMRTAAVEHATALAAVLGAQSTAALRFDDPDTGRDILDCLRQEPPIRYAAVFHPDGRAFAYYHANGVVRMPEKAPAADGHWFTTDGHLDVAQPIVHHGERLGTIFIRISMEQLGREVREYLLIAAAVLLVSLATAALLAYG